MLMGHSMGALSASAAAATYLYDDISSQNNENKDEMINEKAFKNITLVLVSPAFSFTKEQRNQSLANQSLLSTSTPDNRSLDILQNIATSVKQTLKPKPVVPKSLFKNMFAFLKDFLKSLFKLPVKIMLRR
jgi:pimeloyl-ACP methyl ester carboxylesterase